AASRGLAAGFGIEIRPRDLDDATRFDRFVTRVELRSQCSIVVGAAPERLELLCHELAAAGYTTAGASDPPTLVALAAAAARTPDLVVIDRSLCTLEPRAAQVA